MTHPIEPGAGVDACAVDVAPAAGARRRPEPSVAVVERVLRREFDVVIEGERQRLPLAEAVVVQLAHRALKGEIWAVKEMLRHMERVDRVRAAQNAARARRLLERARASRERRAEQARRERADRTARGMVLAAASAIYDPKSPTTVHSAALYETCVSLGVLGPPNDLGLRTLEPWVVDSAHARDPELAGRMTVEELTRQARAVQGARRARLE